MIYLDTSVVVAHLLAGDRRPAIAIWQRSLVASTLLENATWTRLHACHFADTHGEAAGGVLGKIAFGELATAVLDRALVLIPVHVRTLDALHLATCDFLRARGQRIALATYDQKSAAAGRAIGLKLFDLEALESLANAAPPGWGASTTHGQLS